MPLYREVERTQMKIYVNNDLLEFVEHLAKTRERSKSDCINAALHAYRQKLDQHKTDRARRKSRLQAGNHAA